MKTLITIILATLLAACGDCPPDAVIAPPEVVTVAAPEPIVTPPVAAPQPPVIAEVKPQAEVVCQGCTVAPARTLFKVELRGDSITQAANQTLTNYLVAADVVNLGLGGQKAGDMLAGTYGAMPTILDKDTFYSFSFGANECIRNVGVSTYAANIEQIIVKMKGFKTIIEAPWKITTTENDCNNQIESYRQAVVTLVNQYANASGYLVAMPELDMMQDMAGDKIHPAQPQLDHRAQLMANAIYAFKAPVVCKRNAQPLVYIAPFWVDNCGNKYGQTN